MCNICWAVGQSQLHQSYFCLNFHPSKNIWSQFFRLHQNEAPSGINQFRISTMKLNEHQKHEGFRYKLHQWKQVLRPGKWRTISLKKPRHLWIVSGICRLAWFYASPQIPVMKGLFVMPQCTPLYKPKATWGYVESIHRLTEWKSGFFEEFWDFWNGWAIYGLRHSNEACDTQWAEESKIIRNLWMQIKKDPPRKITQISKI